MKKKILEFSTWIGKSVSDTIYENWKEESPFYSKEDKEQLIANINKMIDDLKAVEQYLKDN